MSILRARVMSGGGQGAGYHPVGTGDTPMVMPMSAHTYTGSDILYGTLHPLITADGGVVPATADVTYPPAVPAGRP